GHRLRPRGGDRGSAAGRWRRDRLRRNPEPGTRRDTWYVRSLTEVKASLSFRILGPLAVAAAGEELDLGAPRQQAVLGVLLLRPGRLVPASTIVTDLWGDAPPGRAENSVQVHVSRLRRALPSELLVTRAPGYLIDVEPGQVAAVRFA